MTSFVRLAILWLLALAVAALFPFLPTLAPAGEVSYDVAYAAAQQGQPLVILCSAEWCGTCQQLKRAMRAAPRQFVVLDIDRPFQTEAKTMFYRGGTIPQVWVWQKINGEWRKWRER